MRSSGIVLLCIVAVFVSSGRADPYWQQQVNYTIDVTLDPDTHMLSGDEIIVYRNLSPDTLKDIYLHLYPNAFRDEQTTFREEERRFHNFTFLGLPEESRSLIDITDFRIEGSAVPFIVEETILRADLVHGLAPGEEMTVSLSFLEKMGQKYDRAGYVDRHYDVAQWYPKAVVYDQKGWHPDQFHCLGEFYGEFGTFDVNITIPDEYVIAATGECVGGDPGWEKNRPMSVESTLPDMEESDQPEQQGEVINKTVSFHAENVHDFAWCADPDYVVQDTIWNGISVKSFYRGWNSEWADSNLAYTLSAMQWLGKKVGPYPYPQVSVADVPWGGGMEYPMLVMNGFVDESLVLHEVSHIYFYGILANNELDEAWLDEGFATFQEQWYSETKYGPYGKEPDRNWHKRLQPTMSRRAMDQGWLLDLGRARDWEIVATPAHQFKESGWAMVYGKAAEFLWMLKYLVGDVVFDQIMRTYYTEWQFKHVDEACFRQVCEQVSGMDLDWFFDQWLHSTDLCDYAIENVETQWSWQMATRVYQTIVAVRRLGDIVMPVEVHLRLADGSVLVKRLEGRSIRETVIFGADEEPRGVSLNPGNEILDINMLNNHHPWKTRFALDLPKTEYYPQDAYLVRHRPSLWYNRTDGMKMGWLFKGSFAESYSKCALGFYYGFISDRLDMSFAASTPLKGVGAHATGGLEASKTEGRMQARVYVRKNFRRHLAYPPDIYLDLGLSHFEVRDWRYVDAGQWDLGKIDKMFIGLSSNPSADIFSSHISLQVANAARTLGSDHEFTAVRGELTLKTEFEDHNASLRMFYGQASSRAPLQERFSLAGAGPLERFNRFFLRSRDSSPEDLNYHLGGDGNLRGYLDSGLGVRRLVALNVEYLLPRQFPDWLRTMTDYTGISYRAVVFGDMGKVFDGDRPAVLAHSFLYDLGAGLRLHRETPLGMIRLRLDFPLYVNRPSLNGEKHEFDFRWLVSLAEAF